MSTSIWNKLQILLRRRQFHSELEEEMERTKSKQTRKKLSKRMKLVEGFRTSQTCSNMSCHGGVKAPSWQNGSIIATVDAFAYASCPGNAVALTAIDYEYQGMPATLPAGLNKFKLTNAAPKEAHEFGIAKLTAAGAAMDPQKLLALPEKKLGKFVDFEHASGTYAEPGTSGYTVADLDPGTYIYLCSLHVGGKKTGPLHFMKGMYGIVTVA